MNNHHLIGKLSHLLAIVILGTMAGFFWTYSINVNQAMLRVDGQTYATVQSLFNVTVRNPVFFIFFFGGGAFTLLTLILNYPIRQQWSYRLLIGAALIYCLGIIAFTHQVNLPLNYYTESWNPAQLPNDWQSIRNSWNEANWIRVITSMTAFVLAVVSLGLRKAPQH